MKTVWFNSSLKPLRLTVCKAKLVRSFLKGRLFITSTSIFLARGVSGSRTRRSASRQLRHGRTRKERVVRKLLADSQTRVMRKKARAVGHARKAAFCLLLHAFSARRRVGCLLQTCQANFASPDGRPTIQTRRVATRNLRGRKKVLCSRRK